MTVKDDDEDGFFIDDLFLFINASNKLILDDADADEDEGLCSCFINASYKLILDDADGDEDDGKDDGKDEGKDDVEDDDEDRLDNSSNKLILVEDDDEDGLYNSSYKMGSLSMVSVLVFSIHHTNSHSMMTMMKMLLLQMMPALAYNCAQFIKQTHTR